MADFLQVPAGALADSDNLPRRGGRSGAGWFGGARSRRRQRDRALHAAATLRVGRPLRIALAGAGILLALAVLWFFAWPRYGLGPSGQGLARLNIGGAGGRFVGATASFQGREVALADDGGWLVPASTIPAGARVEVAAEVRTPSWLAWLAGGTRHLAVGVTTPSASLLDPVEVVRPGGALVAHFSVPVSEVSVQAGAGDPTERLARPSSAVAVIPQLAEGQAGTVRIAAVPETWESLPPAAPLVYFATVGQTPMAILSPPAATTALAVDSPVELTLSEPVSIAFGDKRPTLVPVIEGAPVPKGTWSEPTSYSLLFTPDAPAFWPGEQFRLSLPAAVRLSVGPTGFSAPTRSIAVQGAPGSTLRLQRMLASLGYLPLDWSPAAPGPEPRTMAGQAALISSPPAGAFTWRWRFPSQLTSLWAPGVDTVITKGAVRTFEQVEGLVPVGQANPLLWPTLINAVLAHQGDPYPYTWIQVSEQLPETLWLWSDGKVVLTSLANTGIPQDPTELGTFPIYLRFKFNYMSGHNPDGSYYHDPVYWIDYFFEGDAVHGFARASYGYPQSLGCVELPVSVAAQVFPKVHIGTLVTVY